MVATEPDPAVDGGLTALSVGLESAAGQLRGLVDAVPDRQAAVGLPIDELDGCLAHLKRLEGTLAAIKARLIAAADHAKAHTAHGMTSTDSYLRDRLGISSREARKQRDLARTLEQMDAAADAVADGRLGTEQATAMGRAARNGNLGSPDQVQDQLLDQATTSTPEQLNNTIRRAEQHANADALRRGENRAYHQRRAWCTQQTDGSWQLHAFLDPVAGEHFATTLAAFTTPDPADTPPGRRRRPEQRTADALTALADTATGNNNSSNSSGGNPAHISVIVPYDAWHHHTSNPDGTGSGNGGDGGDGNGPGDGGDGPGGQGTTDTAGPNGHHSDASSSLAGPLLAELGSGTPISPQAAQRLICDAKITRIVMNARSQILNVGRATRTWTTAQRTAAAARDRTCRGPGCDRPLAWCELHHVQWWSHGGPTDLDYGIHLCKHHHRLIHEDGWTLHFNPTTNIATFTDPTGKRHTTQPRGSPP